MKLLLMFFIVFLSFVFPSFVIAAEYSGSGKVSDILIRPSLDAFAIIYIDGFTDAGDCPKYESKNLVIISIKDDKYAQSIYGMALAAHMAEKTLKIKLNDIVKDANGNCQIKDIRLNKSF